MNNLIHEKLNAFRIDRSFDQKIAENSQLDLMLKDFESCFEPGTPIKPEYTKTFASGTLVTVINSLASVIDIRTERMLILKKTYGGRILGNFHSSKIPDLSKLLSKTYWNIKYGKNEIKEGRSCFEIPNG